MPAALLHTITSATVGDTLRMFVLVTDTDGTGATPDAITVDVTLPDGTADTGAAAAQPATGLYECTYDLAQPGLTTVVITVTSADFGDDVLTAVLNVHGTSGAAVDLEAVKAYLGDTSHSDAEINDALESEAAAQARRCRIPADHPQDLVQALKRRVARNLAARAVPVASYTTFEGGGTGARVPKYDAEIARLEGPFLKLVAP